MQCSITALREDADAAGCDACVPFTRTSHCWVALAAFAALTTRQPIGLIIATIVLAKELLIAVDEWVEAN